MENKIIFTIAVIGMLGSVFGIFGGMFFEDVKVMMIGMFIWALALVGILARAGWNYLN